MMEDNMKTIHGGDIYRNTVSVDFSVNVNPLGIPDSVKQALHEAVDVVGTYPDIHVEQLTKKMAEHLGTGAEALIFGNGASELFLAIIHGVRPKKIVIPVPSFYGYEHAAKAGNAEIVYCEQQWQIVREALENAELLFLANPNNPTGSVRTCEELRTIMEYCEQKKIWLVLDECFIEFCGDAYSLLSSYRMYPHTIFVRAFTKIYTIPGVRLGYLVNSHPKLLEKIRMQLPEWNVSVFAQKAGLSCLEEQEFLERTVAYVTQEREFLEIGLQKLGMEVIPSKTNFLLCYSEKNLYQMLLSRGILIRDCKNFRGLREGYYRIAVKNRQENQLLLQVLGEIYWNEK